MRNFFSLLVTLFLGLLITSVAPKPLPLCFGLQLHFGEIIKCFDFGRRFVQMCVYKYEGAVWPVINHYSAPPFANKKQTDEAQ